MSEGVFEKNLKAMETWYPEFADLIREKEGIEDDTEVWPELSWDCLLYTSPSPRDA